MSAWLFQDYRRKQKFGEEKCPWSVGWIDPDGRRRSKKIGTEKQAQTFARKIEGQLAAGTYQASSRKPWAEFRAEYEAKIAVHLRPRSREQALLALNQFERVIKPKRVAAIKTAMIDDYVARRRLEPGLKKGSVVSPATVNKELRHIKAVLRVAKDWGYLADVPRMRMLREPVKIPRYVTPDHFAAIYEAAGVATCPKASNYSPTAWWRALLTFTYMTGWRISEVLALRWDDVSLDNGTAITRHGDNKGRRDDLIPLHPVVIGHLRRIIDFGPLVFCWPHTHRRLWEDFGKIQVAAGIDLPCHEQQHEHSPACHRYGFHDLRRAFATVNAETLSADALQSLMRHKSYQTTQRYINMAEQINRSVEKLYVPEVLCKKVRFQ